MSEHKYLCRQDHGDSRDRFFAPPSPALMVKLPVRVDLREKPMPPVYDQGQLGSCTANAVGAADQFEQLRESASTAFNPSRLFIYYNSRAIEGTEDEDAGASLRDTLKAIVGKGVCPESEWPYIVTSYTVRPPVNCYDHALNHQVIEYARLWQFPQLLKACIASGFPFVFGARVYASFESSEVARTGKVPMPQKREQLLGGHALMCVGYDDAKSLYIVRNSWGADWGDHGYCYMPQAYLHNPSLCSDMWTIRKVEVDATA